MKSYFWGFLGMLTMLFVVAGCATGQDPLHALEQDIIVLQKQQTKMQADFERRLSSIEKSLLRQEKFLAETAEAAQAQDYFNFNVSGTAAMIPQAQPHARNDTPRDPKPGLQNNPAALRPDRRLTGGLADDVVPAPLPKNHSVPAKKTSPLGLETTAQIKAEADPGWAFYAQALKKYFSGDYDQARADFLAFASRYPDHPLQPNALYWLAETHYAQKQYAQAILVFKELTRRFPQSHKVPDALLKAGYAYERLGDIPNARFHLQIVLEDYPNTPAARLARERIATLAGS